MKFVIEGPVESWKEEDSGCARIAELPDDEPISGDERGRMILHLMGEEDEFFVRLHSWSENKNHPITGVLQGQRVRITIEVLD